MKSSLAPGSKVVTEYYDRAGLTPFLEQLGFHTVGYGCTTCIGNSGPLAGPISKAVDDGDLVVCSVLSGNRNFEARIHPEVKANYLASPPLVVAYALAGRMDIDLAERAARARARTATDVFLSRHLADRERGPGDDRERRSRRRCSAPRTPTSSPATTTGASCRCRRASSSPGSPTRPTSGCRRTSTRCPRRRAPSRTSPARAASSGSATRSRPTTSRRRARSSPTRRPARYLTEHGVERKDFNSYGSRRGNHEVMVRGTFANVRLRNLLVPARREPGRCTCRRARR